MSEKLNYAFSISPEMLFDQQAEQILLRTLINNPFCFYDASKMLSVEDFWHEENKVIWKTLERLISDGILVDQETIVQAIQGTELSDHFKNTNGPAGYFAYSEIGRDSARFETRQEALPFIKMQAAKLRRVSIRRQAVHTMYESLCKLDAMLAVDDYEPVITETNERLTGILARCGARTQSFDDAVPATTDHLKQIYAGEISDIVPSGIVDLDEAMNGGFRKKWIYLIGGITSKGKTAYMTSVMDNLVGTHNRFLAFSLEQETKEIIIRIIARRTGLSASAIRSPYLLTRDQERVFAAAKEIKSMGDWISDDREMYVEDLRKEAQFIKAKSGLDLIFVDYIDELDVKGVKGRQFTDEYVAGKRIKILRAMAEELNVAMVVFAQFNHYAEDGKEPQLNWFRGSRRMAFSPDVTMMLFTKGKEPNWEYMMRFGKQRNGPKDFNVALTFRKEIPAFYSWSGRDEAK